MSGTAFRAKVSWGDGSGSFFYFDTEDEARRFDPNRSRPVYGLITGELLGYKRRAA